MGEACGKNPFFSFMKIVVCTLKFFLTDKDGDEGDDDEESGDDSEVRGLGNELSYPLLSLLSLLIMLSHILTR